MPDVWTTNPEKLRNTLQEAGLQCGVEPRVILDRDKEWTCIYDSKGWLRDIYIHDVNELLQHDYFFNLILLIALCALLVGLVAGRWFWRRSLYSHGQKH